MATSNMVTHMVAGAIETTPVNAAIHNPLTIAGQTAAASSPVPAMDSVTAVMAGSAWETNKAEDVVDESKNSNMQVGGTAKDPGVGSHSVPTFVKPYLAGEDTARLVPMGEVLDKVYDAIMGAFGGDTVVDKTQTQKPQHNESSKNCRQWREKNTAKQHEPPRPQLQQKHNTTPVVRQH